jgi:DNA-binding transcriptional MocR family regulator
VIESDALIVSDKVYDFLWWPQGKSLFLCDAAVVLPPRLVDIKREIDPESEWGNTVSNGSFSKIIAPGVRVSWAEGTSALATWLANT